MSQPNNTSSRVSHDAATATPNKPSASLASNFVVKILNLYRSAHRNQDLVWVPPRGNEPARRILHTLHVRFDVTKWNIIEYQKLAELMIIHRIVALPLNGRQVDLLVEGLANVVHFGAAKSAAQICFELEFSPAFASVLEASYEALAVSGSERNMEETSMNDGNNRLKLWTPADVSTLMRHLLLFPRFFEHTALLIRPHEIDKSELTYLACIMRRPEWQIASFMISEHFRKARLDLVRRSNETADQSFGARISSNRWHSCGQFSVLLTRVKLMWNKFIHLSQRYPNATQRLWDSGLLKGLDQVLEMTETSLGSVTSRRPRYAAEDLIPKKPVFAGLEAAMKRLDELYQHFPNNQTVDYYGSVQLGTCAFANGTCKARLVRGVHCEEHQGVYTQWYQATLAVHHCMSQIERIVSPLKRLISTIVSQQIENAIVKEEYIPIYEAVGKDRPPSYDDGSES